MYESGKDRAEYNDLLRRLAASSYLSVKSRRPEVVRVATVAAYEGRGRRGPTH